MAKQITTGKRDKEKQKQAKRIEKQQRKEGRKSTGGSSFEDMIAYVDENGVITTTPPVVTNREEVDIENIQISTPKKTEVAEDTVLNGRVEHFNTSKGYGFIKDINSTEKYFFHISAAPAGITENDVVTFELERGTRGLNAIKIKK